MEKFIIYGSQRLFGDISISGAKNAALPILCAGLLTADDLHLSNIPDLKDVKTILQLMRHMGLHIEQNGDKVILNGNNINNLEAPYELVKTMRASILVLGPLLARFGEVKISLPGGCAIGSRPVDQHIKGLQAMGAEIIIDADYIHAKAQRLKGARIVTDMITVTGTENLLMAAVLADGETILENAACEPEVSDLAQLLVSMGAKIKGIGSNRLIIEGVNRLHSATHVVVADRIETGTFLCAVIATGGDVVLKNTRSDFLDAVLNKLRHTGANLTIGVNWIRVQMTKRPRAVSFCTTEYPGFPTDMQAQFMALNCISNGMSYVTETIFENRFSHVQELNRLGGLVYIEGNTAIIKGIKKFVGASVIATDLRASASLVIAGLAAHGETMIERIYHLDRGYDKMEIKLLSIGACIRRINNLQLGIS